MELVYSIPIIILGVIVILSIWHLVRHPLTERRPASWGILLMLASIPSFSVWHFSDANQYGPLHSATSIMIWPFMTCLVAGAAFAVGDVLAWLIIALRNRGRRSTPPS
jgi:hypothetical protein